MNSYSLILLITLILTSCSEEKKSEEQKNFTYVSKNELVLRTTKASFPRQDEPALHDVAHGPESRYYKLQNQHKIITNLKETCKSDHCDQYEALVKKSENRLFEFLQGEDSEITYYEDTMAQTDSYCTFDNYSPDTYDPPKVFNLRFVLPKKDSYKAPGGFEEETNGNGGFWPKARDYVYLFVLRSNELLKNNRPNPLTPSVPVLPIKMLLRSEGYEIVPIPDQDLHKYYYHAPHPNSGIVANNYYLYDRFAKSMEHVTVTIVSQNGSENFFGGKLKNEAGKLKKLSNGQFDLELHPYFEINTSAYVNEILAHGRPSHVVRINGWLGDVLTHKVWEKQTGTNEFKEVPVMPEWTLAGIFNHEMGHNLGLNHTYTGLQTIIDPLDLGRTTYYLCSDITLNSTSPWCGSGDNNVMDYNCRQDSFTPCQLKVIHWNAMKSTMSEALYKPGCADSAYDVVIDENLGDVHWDAPHHVIGNIIVKNGSRLHIHCLGTTLAQDAKIIKEGNAQVFGEEFITRREKDRYCQK